MVYAYPLAPIANFLATVLVIVPLSRDVFPFMERWRLHVRDLGVSTKLHERRECSSLV